MSLKSLVLCAALASAYASSAMQKDTQSHKVPLAHSVGLNTAAAVYEATKIPTTPIIAGSCTTLLGMGIVPTALAATAAYHAYNYYTQPGK